MFRLFFFFVVGAAAVIWVEPRWSASERTLALRLRSTGEILDIVRAESRDLGRRAAEEIGERLRTPEVASAPPEPDPAALPMTDPVAPGADATAAAHDGITHSDRERLDRLIEEKLREE